MHRLLSLLFLSILLNLISSVPGYGQFHNGSHLEFGKSRVQHTDFVWSYYKFNKYDVYFYTGGKELAIYAANTAEQIIEETEGFFDYSLDGKLQLIVFNKLSDLKQSNIGLATQEDANVGGGTRMVGSKIFLYFNGDHNHLEKQIRSGIAEVLISQMIYGGSWKDRVKNSTLLTLPAWYLEGLISYVSEGWNTDIENRVRDGILSGRYRRFNRLSGIEATYAGHSIWNFISERYGSSLIPSILYMTKVSRNIESGMLFVIGSNLSRLSDDWLRFYQNKYFNTNKTKQLPTSSTIVKRPRTNRVYSRLKLSPNGENAAFVTNIMGKYKVWVYNFESNKFKKVMKFGYKLDGLNDHTYPLLDWHPNSKMLSILSEKKDQLYLRYYFPETKKLESRPIHHFQKILSMSYSSDGKKFVLSGIKKGQTDLFIYHISKNTFENITNDIYDDYEPIFIHDDRDILFSSNRISDTLHSSPNWQDNLPLRIGRKKDLFLYSSSSKSKVMKRVTNTLEAEESNPIRLSEKYISYLSDESGITNRVLVQFDSVISHVDTIAHYKFQTTSTPVSNYSRNIVEQNTGNNGSKLGQIVFSKGRYRMYVDTLSIEGLLQDAESISFPTKNNTNFPKQQQNNIEQNKNNNPNNKKSNKQPILELPEDYIDINNYVFEIEKKAQDPPKSSNNKEETTNLEIDAASDTTINQDTTKTKENLKTTLVRKINSMHVPSKQWNYNTAYASDYFISQLDNRYLSSTYQKFTGGGAIYTNPGLNLFFKVGISDLLEDYRIVGGMRLSSNLTNNEFFLSYENLKKRLDKQLVLHRQTLVTFQSSGTGIKIQTHDARFVLKWPFTEIFFIKGAASIRNDRNVTLSTDVSSLKEPNSFDTWGGFTGELVFDNTIKKGLNLYNGTRTKFFAEWFKQVDKEQTNLFVLGFDWRNYFKIHRDIIWANRLATSTSFGDQKLVYYMGGVDGWLKPAFNNNIDIAQDQNYAYQTLATNMRGFDQNIRNGNSFAVINSEIRFPIFKYFTKKPMKSDFLKNFQIVPFADIGTAWTGPNPYTQDNSFNTDNIQTGPLTIRLTHQREPIVAGYGMGLRTRVWGYFIRVDWARGIEDGILLDPMIYWSLNLDF